MFTTHTNSFVTHKATGITIIFLYTETCVYASMQKSLMDKTHIDMNVNMV